jgi:hypothetical protein
MGHEGPDQSGREVLREETRISGPVPPERPPEEGSALSWRKLEYEPIGWLYSEILSTVAVMQRLVGHLAEKVADSPLRLPKKKIGGG